MKPVDYLPGARSDFDDSFDWYAARSAVASERFTVAVDPALNKIASNPEQFALVDQRHRECLVKRFPFRIIYRSEVDRVIVVAIAHAKRRPGYWERRK
jgi:plasmid stabilization system protein ParE